MKNFKKLFGGIDLTWKKLIIFSILAGVYTAIMAILPITENTSFEDITITLEVWILFGIVIIMNSKSAKDSALKCFVFFLISQPLIYLIQVPFTVLGWQIFAFYRNWFIWTLCTILMGYIGYFIKKDKWWGLGILTPILLILVHPYTMHLSEAIYNFPYHLLSTLFCIATFLIYPLCLFKNRKLKIAGFIISILIILATTIITLSKYTGYKTTVLVNGGSAGATFDGSYNVYLKDSSYGKVYIIYDESIEDYMVNAEFKKAGKTNLILQDSNGNKEVYEIDIKSNKYEINKKESFNLIDNKNEKETNKEPSQWKTENVKITVEEDSITKTSANIIIEDKNENAVSWGLDFAIQKSGDNDKWVDMITKEKISWIEIAIKPNENGITEMQLDWSEMYGEFNLGTYRVVKYNGLSTLYSEPFTIK